MKNNVMLTVASLLASYDLHPTDGDQKHEGAVRVAAWSSSSSCGCAEPSVVGRAWGYVITLLGGLFAAAMIVVTRGAVSKSGGFFFIWTMFAQHHGMAPRDPRPVDCG
jgi:hypothetical protein